MLLRKPCESGLFFAPLLPHFHDVLKPRAVTVGQLLLTR